MCNTFIKIFGFQCLYLPCCSTTGTVTKAMLDDSPNAALDKTLLNKYYDLPQPENKIQAKYVWIDGTGEFIRSKSRTLDFVPKDPAGNVMLVYIM